MANNAVQGIVGAAAAVSGLLGMATSPTPPATSDQAATVVEAQAEARSESVNTDSSAASRSANPPAQDD